MVVYASKLVTLAVISAGMIGEALARTMVYGVSIDTVAPTAAGGIGLLVIALRLWRDERFAREQRRFYEARARFEYARGAADREVGNVTAAEALQRVADSDHPHPMDPTD